MYELKNAELREIKDIVQVTETFKKQTIVLEQREGRYIDTYAIEIWDEKTHLIKDLVIGKRYNISFAIRSREKDGKYFTNLLYIKHTEVEQSTNDKNTIIEKTS